jgi:hypothetical protein
METDRDRSPEVPRRHDCCFRIEIDQRQYPSPTIRLSTPERLVQPLMSSAGLLQPCVRPRGDCSFAAQAGTRSLPKPPLRSTTTRCALWSAGHCRFHERRGALAGEWRGLLASASGHSPPKAEARSSWLRRRQFRSLVGTRETAGARCGCVRRSRGYPLLERAQLGLERRQALGRDVVGADSPAMAQRLWLTTSTLWPSGSSTKAP